jgi:multidrug efflux system membrane fusion protein
VGSFVRRLSVRPWLPALILIAIAGTFVVLYRGRHSKVAAAPGAPAAKSTSTGRAGRGAAGPTPVTASKAYKGDVPVFQTGLGSVQAYYTVSVRTRVDGELMNVAVREGQYVTSGQMLAQIDPRPFHVQLEQAQGQLERDEALLANAHIDLARYETLVREGAVTRQQRDTQASLVRQYEGNVKQDESAIHNAELQLKYARITAPISGRIGLRQVDPGNIVHATDTTGLFVITQLQPIAALFTVAEDELPPVLDKLRAGATLRVDAYNRDFSHKLDEGRLLTVDNQIDPQTGTSRLKAVFANRGGLMFPNQFVNVRLLVSTSRDQVIIPIVALQRGQQGTFVYVVRRDNTVEVRPVVTGVSTDDIVTIQNGLKAGETVVTNGTDRLQPGSAVRVRPPGSLAPSTTDANSQPESGGAPSQDGANGAEAMPSGAPASQPASMGKVGPQNNAGTEPQRKSGAKPR